MYSSKDVNSDGASEFCDTAMTVLLSGLSYRKTGIATRERLAVEVENEQELLGEFLKCPFFSEAVLVSTCNRVELVTVVPAFGSVLEDARRHIEGVFESNAGLGKNALREEFYHLDGMSAVRHLFRVASGLDSLVLGEPQILGQLKKAFCRALDGGFTSVILNRLFQKAFGVGKAIRTHTNIGRKAVSVCYAARELARHIFGDLVNARVMLIGTGDVGALSLRHFSSAGVKSICIASSSLERAVEVGKNFDAIVLPLHKLEEFLPQVDIIIGASSVSMSNGSIIDRLMASEALAQRCGESQFYIDLGVPRNFASGIAELPDAYLYNIDDLEDIVRQNIDERELETDRAELIVAEEVEKFSVWLARRSVDPVIRDVVRWCSDLQEREIAKTMRRLQRDCEGFSESEHRELRSALGRLCSALIAKTLHRPVSVLKERGNHNRPLLLAFKELFLQDDSA